MRGKRGQSLGPRAAATRRATMLEPSPLGVPCVLLFFRFSFRDKRAWAAVQGQLTEAG